MRTTGLLLYDSMHTYVHGQCHERLRVAHSPAVPAFGMRDAAALFSVPQCRVGRILMLCYCVMSLWPRLQVCASRFWFNYRHVGNALSVYHTIKAQGIPDSNIILMLADDMACNARNPTKGAVYYDASHSVNL